MPDLPLELIAAIVADAVACTDIESEATTLSAFALVARLWRTHANAHRFSTIVVYTDGTISTPRLQGLAELVSSDMWPKHAGIAQNIQNFSLIRGVRHLGDEWFDADDPRRNASISTVLRAIFRGDGGNVHLATQRKNFLYIKAQNVWEYAGAEGGHGFSFTALHPYLIASLHDLCRSPFLTSLHLECVSDVPSAMVCSSTLSELFLAKVTFRPSILPATIDVGRNCPLPNLKVLTLDTAPSFLGVVLRNCDPPPLLTELDVDYWLDSGNEQPDRYGALYRLGKTIKELSIQFHDEFDRPCDPIDYSQIHPLSALWLTLERNEYTNDDNTIYFDTKPPAFLSVSLLLPPTLPPALHIDIVSDSNSYARPPSPHGGLEELYLLLDHPALADRLERSLKGSPDTRVTIALDIRINTHERTFAPPEVESELVAYLKGRLARLDKMEGVELQIYLTTPASVG